METLIHTYDYNQTINSQVNYEKLDIEVKTSTVQDYMRVFKHVDGAGQGKIYVELEKTESSSDDKTALDAVIAAHDGQYADVTEDFVEFRERKIREMVQMANYHPLLDELTTTEYLTSIDNYFNSWKRSGVDQVLISKIFEDAGVSDIAGTSNGVDPATLPFHSFLNTVINPSTGAMVFQFLVAGITG